MGWRIIELLRSALIATALVLLFGGAAQGQQALLTAIVRTTDVAEIDALEVDVPERDPFAAELRDGRITRGFIRHRMLHFTFDDGPRLDTTPALLDHLDEAGVKATFFVVARGFDGTNRVDRAKAELLRDVVARGHTIGAHTYDHSRLTTLDDGAIRAQLIRSEKIITRVLGDRPYLFRAPYGARDARVDAIVAERGYTHMLWNTTAADVSSRSGDEVVEAFRESLDRRERHPRGPGGIVLLHDTKPWVVDAFPAMIEELRTRNCELLEHGEELWDVLDDPSFFHQERGEDPSRQARTVTLEQEIVDARQEVLRNEAAAWCESAQDLAATES